MRMASMRESRDSLLSTQVQSHALMRQGFGTSVPFISFVSTFTLVYVVCPGMNCHSKLPSLCMSCLLETMKCLEGRACAWS